MTIKSNWIEYLYRLATGTKRGRTLLTPVGAVIFGLFTTLFVVSALAFDKWLRLPKITIMPINFYIATPILVASTYITLWSIIRFLKSNGTPVPVNPPPKLVTTGPYAYIRNPMLTGIFILLFGIGVMIGSISLTFIFTPLFILVNAWELKEIEEPELVHRLGEEYIIYRDKTPMFIPTMKIFKNKKGK
jgi:protein-S-isoprenylcysteine O-methyltransferase Ste14